MYNGAPSTIDTTVEIARHCKIISENDFTFCKNNFTSAESLGGLSLIFALRITSDSRILYLLCKVVEALGVEPKSRTTFKWSVSCRTQEIRPRYLTVIHHVVLNEV